MYKFNHNRQYSLDDFDQPIGLNMDPNNRWIKKAATIPWDDIEERYAGLFPSTTGIPAKPLRTALGSLMIQKPLGFSDRELVEEIAENPYFQYFIGLPGYKVEHPFAPSLMVEFRKRLNDDVLAEINEMIIEYNRSDDPNGGDSPDGGGTDEDGSSDNSSSSENKGTLILDATCAPSNIEYPQDINLLNEARLHLEAMIDEICEENDAAKPRTYRNKAHMDYLNLAKCKRRTKKKIRKTIHKQLQYIRRDLKYVYSLMESYGELPKKKMALLKTIQQLYDQQKYMYDNKIHTVPDRIVSISQPYIRPIVRGKAVTPVEFGAKLDLSLDEAGMARIERLSYDPYNESEVLIPAIERYHERTGHYPERVLADQIYRNRKNLQYCKEHGIRLSGPKLGRPKEGDKADKKLAYKDSRDRIAIERAFALAKHSYGLGKITTKLDETTRSSIALSVIVMNVARIQATFSRSYLTLPADWTVNRHPHRHFSNHRSATIIMFSKYTGSHLGPEYEQNKPNEFLEAC